MPDQPLSQVGEALSARESARLVFRLMAHADRRGANDGTLSTYARAYLSECRAADREEADDDR